MFLDLDLSEFAILVSSENIKLLFHSIICILCASAFADLSKVYAQYASRSIRFRLCKHARTSDRKRERERERERMSDCDNEDGFYEFRCVDCKVRSSISLSKEYNPETYKPSCPHCTYVGNGMKLTTGDESNTDTDTSEDTGDPNEEISDDGTPSREELGQKWAKTEAQLREVVGLEIRERLFTASRTEIDWSAYSQSRHGAVANMNLIMLNFVYCKVGVTSSVGWRMLGLEPPWILESVKQTGHSVEPYCDDGNRSWDFMFPLYADSSDNAHELEKAWIKHSRKCSKQGFPWARNLNVKSGGNGPKATGCMFVYIVVGLSRALVARELARVKGKAYTGWTPPIQTIALMNENDKHKDSDYPDDEMSVESA